MSPFQVKQTYFEAAWENYVTALQRADAAGVASTVMLRSAAKQLRRVCRDAGIEAPACVTEDLPS